MLNQQHFQLGLKKYLTKKLSAFLNVRERSDPIMNSRNMIFHRFFLLISNYTFTHESQSKIAENIHYLICKFVFLYDINILMLLNI